MGLDQMALDEVAISRNGFRKHRLTIIIKCEFWICFWIHNHDNFKLNINIYMTDFDINNTTLNHVNDNI